MSAPRYRLFSFKLFCSSSSCHESEIHHVDFKCLGSSLSIQHGDHSEIARLTTDSSALLLYPHWSIQLLQRLVWIDIHLPLERPMNVHWCPPFRISNWALYFCCLHFRLSLDNSVLGGYTYKAMYVKCITCISRSWPTAFHPLSLIPLLRGCRCSCIYYLWSNFLASTPRSSCFHLILKAETLNKC